MNSVVERKPLKIYAAQLVDDEILRTSTSGGIFAGIARYVLTQRGAVFGAAYNGDEVEHIVIEQEEDLSRLQGSKYVASRLGDVFFDVKKRLKNQQWVLFSGTPCQIAGLKAFLGLPYENLITLDLICHGTPSPKLFGLYLKWLGRGGKSEVLRFNFRNKTIAGWTLYGSYTLDGKTKKINPYCDPYYAAFLRGETYRECCYTCKYTSVNRRPGDITIGDFWGLSKYPGNHDFDEYKGVSVVFANTDKGKAVLDKVSIHFKMLELDVKSACEGNANLTHPVQKPAVRDEIYQNIDTMSFDELQCRYLKHDSLLSWKMKRLRRKILPQKVRNFIKKMIGCK